MILSWILGQKQNFYTYAYREKDIQEIKSKTGRMLASGESKQKVLKLLFLMLVKFSFPCLLRICIRNDYRLLYRLLSFTNAFFLYLWRWPFGFLLSFVNIMIYIYRFINIKLSWVSGINPTWLEYIFFKIHR